MSMVRIPAALDLRLEHLAGLTRRSKSTYVKQALSEFLEDKEDYLIAAAALEEHQHKGDKTISLEELCQKLGIDDL